MAETEEHSEGKWDGKISSEIANAEADQIWPLLEDFCNLHKWFPMDTCRHLEGAAGQPGLIRYCETAMGSGEGEKTVMWAKEKLVALDAVERYVTYEVVENNMGFKSYEATMKVVPLGGAGGCKIEWWFECDPMEGWTYEVLFSFIQSSLQSMTKKMEQAFSAAA